MGQKHGRVSTRTDVQSQQNSFKLFEYRCSCCNARRSIQYFYRNGVFLPQQPRVVCGECNTSIVVEPFKTVDYQCPSCHKFQKVRLPGKPMPLNMYNVSVVSCNCGFRGEVAVGKLMECACSECWTAKKELKGVWSEDGDEVRFNCDNCHGQRRGFLRTPQKKGSKTTADMEFTCEQCHKTQGIHAEELLRNQGLAYCGSCAWVGYPETRERAVGAGTANLRKIATLSDGGASTDQGQFAPPPKSKSKLGRSLPPVPRQGGEPQATALAEDLGAPRHLRPLPPHPQASGAAAPQPPRDRRASPRQGHPDPASGFAPVGVLPPMPVQPVLPTEELPTLPSSRGKSRSAVAPTSEMEDLHFPGQLRDTRQKSALTSGARRGKSGSPEIAWGV